MDLFSFLDDCDQESTVSQDVAQIGPLDQDFLSDRKRKNSDCDGEATISQKTEARDYTRPGIATSKRSKLELKLIVLVIERMKRGVGIVHRKRPRFGTRIV